MSNRLVKEDISDFDIIDANELGSDGFDPFLTLPLVSISVDGIFTVDVSSLIIGIIHEPGSTIEPGDRLYLQGATPSEADGYYTIDSLLSDATLTVNETTIAATGGNLFFIYPPGAESVGVDTTNCIHTNSHTVQKAIEDLDLAIAESDGYLSVEDNGVLIEAHATTINFGDNLNVINEGGGKVTVDGYNAVTSVFGRGGDVVAQASDYDAEQIDFTPDGYLVSTNVQDAIEELSAKKLNIDEHASLRELIHLADGVGGPFEEFVSGAYREILPAKAPFPTSVIWWESSAKLKKIVEKTLTLNVNKTPSIIEWKAYDTDGVTVLATISDSIAYDGVFELSRTRTIS